MPAIEVERLRKEFKVPRNREGLKGAVLDLFKRNYTRIVAVKDISFQIREGEICGYIGENGAGKSTTIKMLAGILVPTSGRLLVNGYVPYRERETFVRTIGVVFGQRSQLWWDIGVIESFRLLRKVYRVSEADFRRRLDELTETLQLGDLLNRPVRKLSLGQRMRCELAAALLHNPSILFLDEPTIGLDIVVKTQIREFLKKLNREQGTTILLTTHDLQDIEALCTRVIMLDEGRIIYDGGLEELKERWSKGREIQFRFADPVAASDLAGLTEGLPVRWTPVDEQTARVWVPREINMSEVLSRVVGRAPIRDMSVLETSTDEIVRAIYQSGSAAAPPAEEAPSDGVPAERKRTESAARGTGGEAGAGAGPDAGADGRTGGGTASGGRTSRETEPVGPSDHGTEPGGQESGGAESVGRKGRGADSAGKAEAHVRG